MKTYLLKPVGLALVIGLSLFGAAQRAQADPEPGVEIEVNTSATNDDAVPLSGTTKWDVPTPCRIRMSSAWNQPMTIVLVNPVAGNGQLNYHRLSLSHPTINTAQDGSLTLPLPQDGSWVSFTITGSHGSESVGDAVLKAYKDNTGGSLKKTVHVSVYWWANRNMIVSPHGNYVDNLAVGTLSNVGAPTVNLTARAWLQPAGVSCNAQVSNLRVGIVQNALASTNLVAVYNNPVWNNPTPGDTVTVQSQYQSGFSLPTNADDVPNGQPGPTYVAPASLCSGESTSDDTPLFSVPTTRTLSATTANGIATTVTYTLSSMNINAQFLDWCVLRNNAFPDQSDLNGATQALVELGWTLTVGTGSPYPTAREDTIQNRTPSGSMVLTTTTSQFANHALVPFQSSAGTPVTLN